MRGLGTTVLALIVALGSAQTAFPDESDDILSLCGDTDIVPGNYSGIYKGEWAKGDVSLSHVLVVAEVTPSGNATVYYGYGKQPRWGIEEAKCFRAAGELHANKLSVTLNGPKAEYIFSADGSVSGVYTNNRGSTNGAFTKWR